MGWGNAFYYALNGHFQPCHLMPFFRRVIDPIFQMMLVAAFVVQPRGAVALGLALAVIGAVVAEIIFCADQKFSGGEFG